MCVCVCYFLRGQSLRPTSHPLSAKNIVCTYAAEIESQPDRVETKESVNRLKKWNRRIIFSSKLSRPISAVSTPIFNAKITCHVTKFVLQHTSKSTRCTYFCIDHASNFQQECVKQFRYVKPFLMICFWKRQKVTYNRFFALSNESYFFACLHIWCVVPLKFH